MTDEPKPFRSPFGDIAPALAAYTDEVLFGHVWKRPAASTAAGIARKVFEDAEGG
jgi:4-carboxymuconolactone decarboxylase